MARIGWHSYLQYLLDTYLEVMSGKQVVATGREYTQYFRIDYYCKVGSGKPTKRLGKGIRIFDHLLTYNIFEYKSIHETLSERTFQDYVSRGLHFMTCKEKKTLKGCLTLNILLTRVPKKLFSMKEYEFERLNPWKYRIYCLGLPVYILIQNRMRGVKGGEPMAYYQVLEGDPNYQKQTWGDIVGQNLSGGEDLKKVMIELNREAFMTIVDLIINEARPDIINQARPDIINQVRPGLILEGKVENFLGVLERIASSLLPKYESKLRSLSSLSEFQKLEKEIWSDIAKLG